MHPNDRLKGLIQMVRSERFLPVARGLGMELDFTLNSLKSIEENLQQAIVDFKDRKTLVTLMGIYLGETLIQTLGNGATWGFFHPAEPPRTTFLLNNGEGRAIIYPIEAVENFLQHGISLYSYAKAHSDLFSNSIPLVETGAFFQQQDGYQYQTLILSKEESRQLRAGEKTWEQFAQEHSLRKQ